MDEQKQQLVEKLKSSSNILVTVRNSPTVDQLSACIGLTLMLNKLDKHASAVFSGAIPSTMEFLKPEETLEKNTDSLRDFIIALDKSKADKLRYKVEDKTVKIFITPYRTSISQGDLDFSQGDFNVDVVVALGAHEQQDLDQAITEHGRILHDATVVSINNSSEGNLGNINWQDNSASSLSELVAELSKSLGQGKKGKPLLDEQVATALLTGIVAETDRFSNARTSADTMNISAELMEAGANQQLVATKLEEALEIPATITQNDGQDSAQPNEGDNKPPKPDDGTLEIDHEAAAAESPKAEAKPEPEPEKSAPVKEPEQPASNRPRQQSAEAEISSMLRPEPEELPEIRPLHQHESMLPPVREAPAAEVGDITGVNFMAEQPSGSLLTANVQPEDAIPGQAPLGVTPAVEHAMLSHNGPAAHAQPTDQEKPAPESAQTAAAAPQPVPTSPFPEPTSVPNPSFTPYTPPASQAPTSNTAPQPAAPAAPAPAPVADSPTLTDLEKSVGSPHVAAPVPSDVDSARDEVLRALQESPETPQPIAALNAQPLGGDLHPAPTPASTDLTIDQNGNLQLPQFPAAAQTSPDAANPAQPVAPPEPANEPAPNPMSPADQPMDMPLPPSINLPPPQTAPPTDTQNSSQPAPPPVPPPMVPPFPQI